MKKSRLGKLKIVKAEEPKKTKKEKPVYKDLVEARELTIADGIKLIFSVSSTAEGRPHVDIRTHITSEKYTGLTKKGINFNIELLEEFRQILEIIDEELAEQGI